MKTFVGILLTCTIVEAIPTIRPGAEWSLNGFEYAGLKWLDKRQAKPTEQEVVQAISNCQTQEVSRKLERDQAILDAKDISKTDAQRLNALMTAIDLK